MKRDFAQLKGIGFLILSYVSQGAFSAIFAAMIRAYGIECIKLSIVESHTETIPPDR